MTRLPVIDISSWISCNPLDDRLFNEEQNRVAEEWDLAMSGFGFAIITGHGVDESMFSALLKEGVDFFSQSLSNKMNYNNGDYGHPLGGYTPPGYEKVGLSTGEIDAKVSERLSDQAPSIIKFDPVENFVFTTSPSSFASVHDSSLGCPFPSANAYYIKMNTLLTTLHQLSACSLHLKDINYFEKFYHSSYWPGKEDEMGKNGNVLRITHYPGQTAEILMGSAVSEGSFIRIDLSFCLLICFFLQTMIVYMIARFGMELTLITKGSRFLNQIKLTGIQ
jgi:isopenicillin N synthase-like dioxygenase